MKSNKGLNILFATVLINLSACTYIKSLFPDKEKDYQFTTEINSLTLPPDLSDNPIFKAADAASETTANTENPDVSSKDNSESAVQKTEEKNQEADKATAEETKSTSDAPINGESTKPVAKAAESIQPEQASHAVEQPQSEAEAQIAGSAKPEGEPNEAVQPETNTAEQNSDALEQPVEASPVKKQDKKVVIPVQMVIYNDGETRLRIGAEPAQAWRLVGKALSRHSLEVVSRSLEELSFTVQYDPEEKPAEDGSLWDEVVFFFGGFQTNEKEYLLKLIENNRQTDVGVLDQDGDPASDTGALRLLKLIQTTLAAE